MESERSSVGTSRIDANSPGAPPGGGGFGSPPGGGGFGSPPGGGGFGPPPDGGGFGPPPGGGGFGPPAGGGFGGPGGGAPPDYKTAGTLMMVSGIINLLTAGVWTLALIWLCVGILWVVPLGVAFGEFVVGVAVMNGTPHSQAKTASVLGLIAGVLNMNVFSIVLEIIALVKLGKPEVTAYLSQQR